MSKYGEVRSDFFDEVKGCICIDAWETIGDNEQGKIIAMVYPDKIKYLDDDARTDSYAQEHISQAKNDIREYV